MVDRDGLGRTALTGTGDDPGTPPWLADTRPLTVDIETLEEFARVISDEVELNFIPHLVKVVAKLRSPGPTVAPGDFLELSAAMDTYAAARDRAVSLLSQHAAGSRRLVDAAKTIAARYRQADDFAAITVDDVRAAFTPTASRTQ